MFNSEIWTVFSYPWFIFYSIDSFFFIDQRTFLYRLEKLVLFTVMSCIFFIVCLPLASCLFVDFFLDFHLLFSIFVVGFIVLHIWHFPLQDYLEKKKKISEIMNSCTFMISFLSDIWPIWSLFGYKIEVDFQHFYSFRSWVSRLFHKWLRTKYFALLDNMALGSYSTLPL